MDNHPSRFLFLLFALAPVVISCAGVKVVASDDSIRHEVARIAMSPSGGELADAIVVSMRKSEQNTAEILDTFATAKLIAEALRTLGRSASSGSVVTIPDDIDILVTYQELKRLDIMSIQATLPENLKLLTYMVSLEIKFRDPQTEAVLASGKSARTSLSRKSPEYMVSEVLREIFAKVNSFRLSPSTVADRSGATYPRTYAQSMNPDSGSVAASAETAERR